MTYSARDFAKNGSVRFLASALLCVFLAAQGCISKPYRVHPRFQTETADLQSPLVIFPAVRVYDFTARGRWELRNDWSERVNRNLLLALKHSLEERNYAVRAIPGGEFPPGSDLAEIRALYRAVNKSIRLHTFGPQLFPHKINRFEYSLGDLREFLNLGRGDSLVVVDGFHQIMRGSRRTGISMAVADSTGSILWYCMKVVEDDRDLLNPHEAAVVIETLVASFTGEQA